MTDKFKNADKLMKSYTSWSTGAPAPAYEYGGDDADIAFSDNRCHEYNDINVSSSHDVIESRNPSQGVYEIYGFTKKKADDKMETKKKGNDDMSFVGIIVLNDGLIAFGDSKSSLRDMNGKLYEDKDRRVQKIFWYGRKMLVTHGINQIKLHDDRMYNLEYYINDCIEKEISLDDMLEGIHESCSVMRDGCIYQFMTGEINHGRKITEDIRVAKENITCNRIVHYEKDNPYCLYSNAYPYKEGIDRLMEKFRSNGLYTIDEVKDRFKNWLEARIKAEEMESEYTSVGLPVNIEILRQKH